MDCALETPPYAQEQPTHSAVDVFALHPGKCGEQFQPKGQHGRILETLGVPPNLDFVTHLPDEKCHIDREPLSNQASDSRYLCQGRGEAFSPLAIDSDRDQFLFKFQRTGLFAFCLWQLALPRIKATR